MTIIYVAVFSYFTILRMYSLVSSAWDLGNYNQAIFTTIFNGKLFYYTPDLPANPTGSLFGVHFTPSLSVLFPFYALYPKAEALLVLQSFVLATGSFPVYWLARDILSSRRWGLVFSSMYLLNSALWGINWFDFHPEALIPLSILLVIYSFYKQSWFKLGAFYIISLGIMEQVPILMIPLSLFFIYQHRDFFFRLKRTIQNRNAVLASILLLITAFLWLFLSLKVIQFLSPENPLVFGKVHSWEILGASNPLQIPAAILRNPIGAFNALSFDWMSKVLYLFCILGAFGFLSFFSPTTLFLALPWLGVSMLSNNIVYYNLGVQYPAFILPFVAFASIKGVKNLQRLKTTTRFKSLKTKLLVKFRKEYIILFTFLIIVLSNPFAGINVITYPYTGYGLPSVSSHEEYAIRLTEMIPPEASVLAPQNIFPLVSSRLDAFTPPTSAFMPPGASFLNKLEQLIQKSEYIILDLSTFEAIEPLVLSRVEGKYGLLASLDGIILLKYGYNGTVQLLEPYHRVFDYSDLTIKDGRIISDPDSLSGYVIEVDTNSSVEDDFWYGPFAMLPPGNYSVTFRLKVGKVSDKNQVLLSTNLFRSKVVLGLYGSLSDGYLTSFTFETVEKVYLQQTMLNGKSLSPGKYEEISMNFVADVFGTYEFSGLDVTNDTSLVLDTIELQQTEPLGFVKALPLQFGDFSSVNFDSKHTSQIFALMNLIPEDASLVVQNNLYPLYSNLQNAYPLPSIVTPEGILAYIKSIPREIDFVLFDWNIDMATASKTLTSAHLLDEFGLYAWADGKILLKRGYKGTPIVI